MVLIKLMEPEQGLFLNLIPSTVASFYEVVEPSESVDARDYLINRIVEVLEANPWLCGRLINENIDGEQHVCLTYEKEIANPLDFIHTIKDDRLFIRKEWRSISENISPYLPKIGKYCLDKDEPLCKFLIFQNTTLTELAIVFSLNHTIGDIYTVYFLWKMLDNVANVQSMCAERENKFSEYVQRDTNYSTALTQSEAMNWVFGGLLRRFGRLVRRKNPPRQYMFRVNSEVIKRIKATYNTEDEFVSTNDILSSWFFGREACQTDNITMAINMRNRIPEIRENMAGNYVVGGHYRMPELDNPKTFRTKWTGILSKEQVQSEAPSFQSVMSHARWNVTTNFANFFHEVNIPGYKPSFHMPVGLYNIAIPIPIAGTVVSVYPECSLLIFKTNRDEHAVFLNVCNDLSDNFFDNCEILDGKFLS